jgi:ferredoxin
MDKALAAVEGLGRLNDEDADNLILMPKLTILPANRSADVAQGVLLVKGGEQAGVEMEAGCFSCFCGACVVEVVSGGDNLERPSDEELDVLDEWHKDPERFRLGCCAKIKGPGDIVIRTLH